MPVAATPPPSPSSSPLRLFRSRTLVPVSLPAMDNGALAVREGRIVAVGSYPVLRHAYPEAAVTDCGETVLMPPLSNAHTHLELTHFPEWFKQAGLTPSEDDFVDWLLTVIAVKRQLNMAQLGDSLAEGIRQALRSGTAVVGDNLSRFEVGDRYRDTPLYGRVYLEALGRSEPWCSQALEELERQFGARAPGSLQRGVAPHAPYTVAPDFMARLATFADAHQAPLSLHVAESPAEVEFCREGRGPLVEKVFPLADWPAPPVLGLSPVALLDSRGLLGPRSLVVHGVQVEPPDIELIAQRGCAVVLCPGSNQRLGVGTAPAAAYRAAGVPLALGTDSLASNDSLSLWDELARAASVYGDQLDPAELLSMATWQGAQLLGAGEVCGALRPGLGANFLVLEGDTPTDTATIEEFLVAHGRQCRLLAHYRAGEDLLPSLG